jgi:hypothetical protein
MRERRLERLLDNQSTVYAACGVTLALGLFFIFVWAPHPWGWDGFDHYDRLASALAQGQPFPTLEVPWAYAYFVAAFYRAFGHHPWIPLVAQAVLNACLPLAVFSYARTWLDRPTSVLAAALTGILSFNTVYASTLSSDAVCTVIFMAALIAFANARSRDRWVWYAATGLSAGVAAQLRPNLILVAPVLAGYGVAERPSARRLAQAAVLVLSAAVTLVPWMARNYRLTQVILPTSVHGSVQLWYGSLQVGPYLHSGAHNPRRVFEVPAFPYTSLEQTSIFISAQVNDCGRGWPSATTLVYWTDHDLQRRRSAPPEARAAGGDIVFEIPPIRERAVLYYYFETDWRGVTRVTPQEGDAAPFVYFISNDHLGDLDIHGDLLDIFDLVRIARHIAWDEPLPFEQQLRAGGIGPADLEKAAEILARHVVRRKELPQPVVTSLEHDADRARVQLHDGSSLAIPRAWSGRITDISFDGTLAPLLMQSQVSLPSLAHGHSPGMPATEQGCLGLEEVAVNRVFYRNELAMMRRYWALALDNIRREPWAFAQASLYRAVRVFVIGGSEDPFTTQQFRAGSAVFTAAGAVSVVYVLLLIAGVVMAWRHGYAVTLPLLLIAYVPLTIAFMLTNMRYSITVQPLILIFIAIAVGGALNKLPPVTANPGASSQRSRDTPAQFREPDPASRRACDRRTDSEAAGSG